MVSRIAVGFDFDHTLGIDNKLERTVALELLAKHAAANRISYNVSEAEVAVDEMLKAARASDRSIDSFVAGFFEQFAPNTTVLDAASGYRDAVVQAAPDHVRALPGALDALAALDALGVPYALLTNGWSPLQEEKARLIRFRGPVFVSERIGARKPSRAAFTMLTKYFELPFKKIWYVGDDPEIDCAGARQLGMTAVWFDWEQHRYPDGAAPPSHVIHSLDELPPLVRAARDAS
jgi:HAD superfamily hydrolase (TIGR01549 family)